MVVLKGIPFVISPDLLYVLAKMGHGDELVLADANFPTSSICTSGPKEIRADGLGIPQLLEAILKLLPLDTYVPSPSPLEKMERFAFYERAKRAYAVVATGCVKQGKHLKNAGHLALIVDGGSGQGLQDHQKQWKDYKVNISHCRSGAPCKVLPHRVRMIMRQGNCSVWELDTEERSYSC
ncbi:fucose mutarotase isoform X2 [Girardinichthys multiradiatus]|uniref:fucose mutarotase isoform X2 n=1 Tax=Girardinichthys multiradiatus TaxID=208333 RepID=UPI001FADB4FA|nr:fucose mutarotase isoform X2 [Girardinichthys multiradiatus]